MIDDRECATFASVPPVVVAAWQSAARSNGGLESLTTLLECCDFPPVLVITNRRSSFSDRWQRRAPLAIRVMTDKDHDSPGTRRYFSYLVTLAKNNAWLFALAIRRGRFILHCNDEVALCNFALGARLAGCPVLFHVRDTRADRTPYRFCRWRAFLALASAFLTLSREMRDWWLRYLAFAGRPPRRAAKIRFLYSIVDRLDPPSPRHPHDGSRPLVVGVLGAFCQKKGQLELIQQCCRPLASAPVRFLFFGDTDLDPLYFARCVVAAQPLENRTIFFLGHFDDKSALYRGVDVVLVASRHEGLARAMIEALASGVPVISFDVSSAHEILTTHEAGIVVPKGDYPALVRTLRALASDPTRLTPMSERALSVARALFAPDVIVAAYKTLLGELWHGRKARSLA